jgi:hypothetical protein
MNASKPDISVSESVFSLVRKLEEKRFFMKIKISRQTSEVVIESINRSKRKRSMRGA